MHGIRISCRLWWGIAGLIPAFAVAPAVIHQAGPRQVALIELFTSEGCSSCPPAERWLGELQRDPGLWGSFVPLAFHVNYWDHLGWRDALATPAYTTRQHDYARAWDSNQVYTPAFVRNGLEWRPRTSPFAEPAAKEAGMLTLTWSGAERTADVVYDPGWSQTAKAPAELEVSVALLGGGIVSQVRRGENAGRELRHEFVVLRLAATALRRNPAGAFTARVTLPPREDLATTRRAVAAWVSPRGKTIPLQAVGGWIE